MNKKIKTVEASELSKFKMAAGGEKRYDCVIDEGILKDWVGIGWVDVRTATKNDYKKFPVVTRK